MFLLSFHIQLEIEDESISWPVNDLIHDHREEMSTPVTIIINLLLKDKSFENRVSFTC